MSTQILATDTLLDPIKRCASSLNLSLRRSHFPASHLSRLSRQNPSPLPDISVNYERFSNHQDSHGFIRIYETESTDPLIIRLKEYGADTPLTLSLPYSKAFLLRTEAVQLLKRIENTFWQFVTQPDALIKDISIVLKEEYSKLLHTFNQTEAHYPMDKSLAELFKAQVEKTPEAIALVFESQTLSYHELNRWANGLAHFILAAYQEQHGIILPPETLIALYF